MDIVGTSSLRGLIIEGEATHIQKYAGFERRFVSQGKRMLTLTCA